MSWRTFNEIWEQQARRIGVAESFCAELLDGEAWVWTDRGAVGMPPGQLLKALASLPEKAGREALWEAVCKAVMVDEASDALL